MSISPNIPVAFVAEPRPIGRLVSKGSMTSLEPFDKKYVVILTETMVDRYGCLDVFLMETSTIFHG